MIQSSFLVETADLLLEVSNTTPTEEKDVDTQGTRGSTAKQTPKLCFYSVYSFLKGS